MTTTPRTVHCVRRAIRVWWLAAIATLALSAAPTATFAADAPMVGRISTVAGTGIPGYNGDLVPAAGAQLNAPSGVAVDSGGNVFIADWYNHRVRRIAAATGAITTVAGTGVAGFSGDGGADAARGGYFQWGLDGDAPLPSN